MIVGVPPMLRKTPSAASEKPYFRRKASVTAAKV
jgi:hypothetical protein